MLNKHTKILKLSALSIALMFLLSFVAMGQSSNSDVETYTENENLNGFDFWINVTKSPNYSPSYDGEEIIESGTYELKRYLVLPLSAYNLEWDFINPNLEAILYGVWGENLISDKKGQDEILQFVADSESGLSSFSVEDVSYLTNVDGSTIADGDSGSIITGTVDSINQNDGIAFDDIENNETLEENPINSAEMYEGGGTNTLGDIAENIAEEEDRTLNSSKGENSIMNVSVVSFAFANEDNLEGLHYTFSEENDNSPNDKLGFRKRVILSLKNKYKDVKNNVRNAKSKVQFSAFKKISQAGSKLAGIPRGAKNFISKALPIKALADKVVGAVSIVPKLLKRAVSLLPLLIIGALAIGALVYYFYYRNQ